MHVQNNDAALRSRLRQSVLRVVYENWLASWVRVWACVHVWCVPLLLGKLEKRNSQIRKAHTPGLAGALQAQFW
jgi:hypothetical protein